MPFQANLSVQVSPYSNVLRNCVENCFPEMTNQYMTAFAHDPIIRAAIMQSADSEFHNSFEICDVSWSIKRRSLCGR